MNIKRGEGICLVCGEPLIYYEEEKGMVCCICHEKHKSHAGCEAGHYVCDACHAQKGMNTIMDGCQKSQSRNPIVIMQELMETPYVYMHGPEHHILVGAALLTAYHNCGGQIDFETALKEMRARGSKYPGGSCGFWGCCGAAVSAGMFISIVTKATPLTVESWRLSNQMTSRALEAIANLGGPRCCKRNSFTAVREAVKFVKENLNIEMELPKEIFCGFSRENRECLGVHCPYFT